MADGRKNGMNPNHTLDTITNNKLYSGVCHEFIDATGSYELIVISSLSVAELKLSEITSNSWISTNQLDNRTPWLVVGECRGLNFGTQTQHPAGGGEVRSSIADS